LKPQKYKSHKIHGTIVLRNPLYFGILCKRLLFPVTTLIDISRNSFVGHNALKKHKTRVTISDSAVGLTIAASPYVAAQSFTQ
jgi:hypothetical protein